MLSLRLTNVFHEKEKRKRKKKKKIRYYYFNLYFVRTRFSAFRGKRLHRGTRMEKFRASKEQRLVV